MTNKGLLEITFTVPLKALLHVKKWRICYKLYKTWVQGREFSEQVAKETKERRKRSLKVLSIRRIFV